MLQKSVNWVNSLTNKGFMPCESVYLNLTACSTVISELVTHSLGCDSSQTNEVSSVHKISEHIMVCIIILFRVDFGRHPPMSTPNTS